MYWYPLVYWHRSSVLIPPGILTPLQCTDTPWYIDTAPVYWYPLVYWHPSSMLVTNPPPPPTSMWHLMYFLTYLWNFPQIWRQLQTCHIAPAGQRRISQWQTGDIQGLMTYLWRQGPNNEHSCLLGDTCPQIYYVGAPQGGLHLCRREVSLEGCPCVYVFGYSPGKVGGFSWISVSCSRWD